MNSVHKMTQQSNLQEDQFIGRHYRANYGLGEAEAERIGVEGIRDTAKTWTMCAALMEPRPQLPLMPLMRCGGAGWVDGFYYTGS